MSVTCEETAKRQGTQFEIFVENLFRHYYSGIERNTIYTLVGSRREKIASVQIDISCSLRPFELKWGLLPLIRTRKGLFELKYSNGFTINEDAVNQLYSAYSLLRRQSNVGFKPMAVVTNKDFTQGAYELAEQYGIELIPGGTLRQMYEKYSDLPMESCIRSIRITDYRTKPHHMTLEV
ncbi:MAG: restriction endonuclease [Candidatus Woesearchaeota archaeon]